MPTDSKVESNDLEGFFEKNHGRVLDDFAEATKKGERAVTIPRLSPISGVSEMTYLVNSF